MYIFEVALVSSFYVTEEMELEDLIYCKYQNESITSMFLLNSDMSHDSKFVHLYKSIYVQYFNQIIDIRTCTVDAGKMNPRQT